MFHNRQVLLCSFSESYFNRLPEPQDGLRGARRRLEMGQIEEFR